jgi:hypothetical protein
MYPQPAIRVGQCFNEYGQLNQALADYSAAHYNNCRLIKHKSKLINGEPDNYKYIVYKFKDCQVKCAPHVRINRKARGPNKGNFRVASVRNEHDIECRFFNNLGLTYLGLSAFYVNSYKQFIYII